MQRFVRGNSFWDNSSQSMECGIRLPHVIFHQIFEHRGI